MNDQQALPVPEFAALNVITLVSDPVRAHKLSLMLGSMGIEHLENSPSLEVATARLTEAAFDIVVAEIGSDDHSALLLPEMLRASTSHSAQRSPRVLWWGEYSPAAPQPRRSAWLGRNTLVVNDREFARVGGISLSALECHARVAGQAGVQIEITRSGGQVGLHDALSALIRVHRVDTAYCTGAAAPTDEEVIQTLLSANDLHVEFQPQHDLQTRHIVGAEALVRWRHPTLGDVPASWFLPAVRRLGLDLLLFGFVKKRVIGVLSELRTQQTAVPVAINISSQAICTAEFTQRLTNVMRSANLRPGLLKLELTEYTRTGDGLALSTSLNTLRAAGFAVSLNDFGVGSATLETLASMPFDEIKIDASLVHNIESLVTYRGIVAASIDLARLLNLNIVADGIGNETTMTLLRRLGCRTGQGDALSARMSGHDFVKHMFHSRAN